MAKKIQSKIQVLTLKSVNVPDIKSTHFVNEKWVKWGTDDEYMEFVLDLYANSPTHRSITNTKGNMIVGKGLDGVDEDFRLNPKEPIRRTLKKIGRDYARHNGFAFQILWGKGDKIAEVRHMDFTRIRATPAEDADPLIYKFSRDWKKHNTRQFAPVDIPVFDPETQGKDKRQLYYFYEQDPGVDYYPVPTYNAGFKDMDFEGLYSTFKAASMKNGMFPTVHVQVMGNPSDPEKDTFYEELQNKFGGAEGAGSILITYADQKDEQTVVEPIQINGNDNLFTSWKEDAVQGIITAHQLTSPVLAGISGSGNLSGNANEINTAWEQFQTVYVNDKQESLLEVLKDILQHWNTEINTEDLKIKTDTPVTSIPDIAYDVAEDDQIREWMTDLFGLEFNQEILDEAEKRRAERAQNLPTLPTNVLPPNNLPPGPAAVEPEPVETG